MQALSYFIPHYIPSYIKESYNMELNQVIILLFFTFALAKAADLSTTSHLLKGSVTCLDCDADTDLSGIQVLVKCDKIKKMTVAYTEHDGTFQTQLPSDDSRSSNPFNCMAKIMGGPYQLFTPMRNSLTQITKSSQYFTTSKSLSFYKSCPLKNKCGAKDMGFASSKTIDLPIPKEWGLAPTSYYIPYMPIIGIP